METYDIPGKDFEEFVSSAKEYAKLRMDISKNAKHKDDYNKLIRHYKEDIEKGTLLIGLADELVDDDIVVDASRGVVIYENKKDSRK